MLFRFADWVRRQQLSLRGGSRHSRAGRSSASTRRPVRPRLEVLEERLTPTYDILSFSGVSSFAAIAPNQASGAILVQLQDNTGHAVNATSNLTVKLSSTSSTGEFLDLSGKPLADSSLVIPAGSSSAYFEYEDSQTGKPTVTGLTSSPFAFGGVNLNIQDQLVFTTPAQTLVPGQASKPITIQLQDATGAAANASSDVTVTLSSLSSTGKLLDASGNPLTPNSSGQYSITIAAGTNSASFEYEDTQPGFATLSAFANTGANASQQVNVQYSLAFTTPVQSLATNQPSGAMTVQLQDANGKAVAAASAVTINLSTFSTTGKFLDTSGNPLTGNSITIAAGASSASFEYEDSLAVTPTITATIQGSGFATGASAQQQVYVGIPLAITTPVQTLAPGKASQPITLQLDSPAASDVTVNLSSTSSTGQFLDTSGTPLAGSSIVIPAGFSSAGFEYEDSTTGFPTITAEKSDFTGSAQQQVNVGVSLNFTTVPQTVASGQNSGTITIQLQDSSGKPFAAPNTTFVQLSSTHGGQFLDTSGNPVFSLSIAAGSNSASFEYKNTNSFFSGADSVTAKAPIGFGGLSLSATQQETVTPGAFSSLAFVSSTQTIAAGQPSQPITVQLQKNGAAAAAPSDVTITLSSSSSTGKFLDSSGTPLAGNSIVIPAGANSASFEYEDSQEWTPTLTATVSGSFVENSQTENIGGVTVAFTTPAQTIAAGTPSGTITAQFKDSSGNPVNAPSDASIFLGSNSPTGKFLDTSGNPLTSSTISVAKGSSSASFEYEDSVAGTPSLTVSSGSGVGTQQETVAGPYKLEFTSLGQVLALNQTSKPITISLLDSTSTPATAASNVTVNLSSTSSGGKFLDTSGNPLPGNNLIIPAGSGSASFEYEDSQAGLPALTASDGGLTSNPLQMNVGASLVFTTPPQTLKAGQTSTPLTVQLQDGSGNPIAASNDLTLTVFGGSAGVQILDTSGKSLSGSSITISKGSSSASFEFTSAFGGNLNVSATTGFTGFGAGGATGLLSATQKETVQGLSALVFTTTPQTVPAGQKSQLITLQLQDNTGAAATAPSGGLTVDVGLTAPFFFTFGVATNVQFFDASGNPLSSNNGSFALTIPAGSSTVSFAFQTPQAGSYNLSATVPNGFGSLQQETVQAASPNSLVFVTPAQIVPTGTPSGSITVQLMDKFGNVIQAGSGGLTFNLSSSSSSGQFLSASGDPLASASVTIPQGANSATFEYEDSQAGTPTLTATAGGISQTQPETIAATSGEIHVTNTNDSGAGSLRAAIAAANDNPGSTIVFDSGVTGTIDILTELPNLTANTNLIGPGANVLTVERGSSATGVFGGFAVGVPTTTTVSPPEPIVTISGLTVANFNGAGINNFGYLTLRQDDVSNNQAPSSSPAFFAPSSVGVANQGALTVLDSTIDNNASGIGSASLSLTGASSGGLTVINSTITGNSSAGISISFGPAYIANSTITGNSVPQSSEFSSLGFGSSSSGSGGINSDGQVTLFDTIVAGNTGSPSNPTDVQGAFNSLGNNLIGSANSQSSGFVSTDQVGTATTPIDPKLGPLTNNGGPTPTIALLTGSPAIGAGSSAGAPATDQRGHPRPSGAIDIGAAELTTTVSSTPPTITRNPSSQTVAPGSNVSFLASADGTPTPRVQWQVSTDGGSTFNNVSGATSTTLTLSAVTASMNGYEYEAVFTNSAGTAHTSAATLTVSTLLPPPPPPAPPASPPASPPAPTAPPSLKVPPLLALFDSLLGGIETINANHTETITDRIFGFPLLVSTFDSHGDLVTVDLFGSIDVTILFKLL